MGKHRAESKTEEKKDPPSVSAFKYNANQLGLSVGHLGEKTVLARAAGWWSGLAAMADQPQARQRYTIRHVCDAVRDELAHIGAAPDVASANSEIDALVATMAELYRIEKQARVSRRALRRSVRAIRARRLTDQLAAATAAGVFDEGYAKWARQLVEQADAATPVPSTDASAEESLESEDRSSEDDEDDEDEEDEEEEKESSSNESE
jgi:hypothetical protein